MAYPEELANIPALPPPPGVNSEFDNPTDTMVKPLKLVNLVFVSLATITVAVRLVTRKFISHQRLSWDDALCALAMTGSIVHTAICLDNMNIGYGRHFWDIRALSLSASKIQRLSSVDIVYGLVIYTIKVSILLLYYRLFSVYSSSRRLIYGGIAICTIITLPYLGMAIARAVVCSSFKVVLEHLTFCYTRPVNSSIVSFSAANVISDFYIFAVPISRVRRLHVDRKAKVGLLAVFIVGFVACGMSIIRLVFVAVHFDNSDVFYRGATVSIFSAVEMNLAIICSCSISFPAFYRCGKDALRPILQSITGRSDRQSSRTKSNPVNDFKLLAHGLLDGQVESKNESNTRVIETPPRAATVPPHISLHMTRATIDMEEHSSSRI